MYIVNCRWFTQKASPSTNWVLFVCRVRERLKHLLPVSTSTWQAMDKAGIYFTNKADTLSEADYIESQ